MALTLSRDLKLMTVFCITSQSMSTITALQVQKRNKERVNVYLDGEYAFSLALIEAAQLRKGQSLDPQQIEALRGQDAIHKAVDQGVRFLSYRPRSTSEVRANLKGKDYSETVIEAALEKLERLGYLDDTAFARYWLENRDNFKPRSALALRHELRQKGIADSIIEAVLEPFDEQDAAYRAGENKARRLSGLDRRTFRHKLGSFLQRRGFNYAVSRDVISQLEDELIADDPDFFIEVDFE